MAVVRRTIKKTKKKVTKNQSRKPVTLRKRAEKFARKTKKKIATGRFDTTKVKKKVVKGAKKVTKTTKKVAKSTAQRIASVAAKSLRSPIGKFGPLGFAVTTAYYLGEEFSPKQAQAKAKNVPTTFGEAFKKAYKNNPGGTFTFKGKKYKAVMKKPPKARKEDKVGASTIIGQGGKGRKAGGVIKAQTGTFSFSDTAKKVAEDKSKRKFYRRYLGESLEDYKARIAKKEKLANKKTAPKKTAPKKTSARVSDIMGGAKGPRGPLGGSLDAPKDKIKKKKVSRPGFNFLERRGSRLGQFSDGGLKKINPAKQPGLAALKKKRPDVVAKMGYAKKGTMVQARGCGMSRKKPTKIT